MGAAAQPSTSAGGKFTKALTEVEQTLHQTVLATGSNAGTADAVRAVQSLADEAAFWATQAAAARGGATAASPAAYYAKMLGKIAPRFGSMKDMSRVDVARLMEDAQDVCNALWLGDMDDDETGGASTAFSSFYY